jgi:hypothetical protein
LPPQCKRKSSHWSRLQLVASGAAESARDRACILMRGINVFIVSHHEMSLQVCFISQLARPDRSLVLQSQSVRVAGDRTGRRAYRRWSPLDLAESSQVEWGSRKAARVQVPSAIVASERAVWSGIADGLPGPSSPTSRCDSKMRKSTCAHNQLFGVESQHVILDVATFGACNDGMSGNSRLSPESFPILFVHRPLKQLVRRPC